MHDFHQFEWDDALERDCRTLVRLALAEDLHGEQDWTTIALVPADRTGSASIVAREAGTAAGLTALPIVIAEAKARLNAIGFVSDGQPFETGTNWPRSRATSATCSPSSELLLNLLGRLMGIATLASRYVQEIAGTSARIYDTRKTTPGWRRLEKYAVRCGGACNHRTGLFDAVLIKDNHLAQRSGAAVGSPADAAAAVREARQFLQSPQGAAKQTVLPIEVEVDSLEQLAAVLPAGPDIVLLDNMSSRATPPGRRAAQSPGTARRARSFGRRTPRNNTGNRKHRRGKNQCGCANPFSPRARHRPGLAGVVIAPAVMFLLLSPRRLPASCCKECSLPVLVKVAVSSTGFRVLAD